jgi:hypothetical protein
MRLWLLHASDSLEWTSPTAEPRMNWRSSPC